MAPPASARSSQAYAPLWLKVLVVVLGLLIIAGFIVIAAEIARRISTSNTSHSPAGATFTQRIALPSGAQVLSMNAVGDRLVVHVEDQNGLSTAYVVDPRTGALLGTIAFPPGPAR
ncbi:MAG: hypothetical protein JSR91_24685 [Proteobacteria bacterium]|nr:hypothetical protein [Pseudomonadota bacterium]